MELRSNSFTHEAWIPAEFAFGQIDEKSKVRLAANKNPHLVWSDVPEGTQSFVLLCVDESAPTEAVDVNQLDREVPDFLVRTDFAHWILMNIPLHMQEIQAGQFSHEVSPRGKAGPHMTIKEFRETAMRQGINDYTHWFANDHDMQGDYYGYDGPCPPWNDALVHRYTFTIYALDVVELSLPVDGKLNLHAVTRRMEGHVLAQAALTGLYSLNPRLQPSVE